MPRKNEEPVFRKRQKVAATRDLPGVPAGTAGRVVLIGGYAWVRYRVAFANGVELGMLHAEDLTTQAQAEAAAEAEVTAARRAEREAERAGLREEALAAEAARESEAQAARKSGSAA
jgi:hypothetical protein